MTKYINEIKKNEIKLLNYSYLIFIRDLSITVTFGGIFLHF